MRNAYPRGNRRRYSRERSAERFENRYRSTKMVIYNFVKWWWGPALVVALQWSQEFHLASGNSRHPLSAKHWMFRDSDQATTWGVHGGPGDCRDRNGEQHVGGGREGVGSFQLRFHSCGVLVGPAARADRLRFWRCLADLSELDGTLSLPQPFETVRIFRPFRGLFSAVSTPIFEIKGSFCSIFKFYKIIFTPSEILRIFTRLHRLLLFLLFKNFSAISSSFTKEHWYLKNLSNSGYIFGIRSN